MTVNPLNEEELAVLELLLNKHNFTGMCAGLSAICSVWKTRVAEDIDAELLQGIEAFFDGAAFECKLLCMNLKTPPLWRHHEQYKKALRGTDPPEIRPEPEPEADDG